MRDLKTYLSVASVISTLWFGSLAGLLIEINRFFLDVLTFPFSFWKIQERNNQPIDIGRPKGFFQCIISGSNEIHRYRKMPCQIPLQSHYSWTTWSRALFSHYYGYENNGKIGFNCQLFLSKIGLTTDSSHSTWFQRSIWFSWSKWSRFYMKKILLSMFYSIQVGEDPDSVFLKK